ncbi:MAG: hypothetical protein RMJ55_05020 [Roseiflexaceae bacterium]|nr:hypothetical protein [Roseiflexaceae bacterium]
MAITKASEVRGANPAEAQVTVTCGWREAAGVVKRGLRPWRSPGRLAEVTVTNTAREGAGCDAQVVPVAALAGQWQR